MAITQRLFDELCWHRSLLDNLSNALTVSSHAPHDGSHLLANFDYIAVRIVYSHDALAPRLFARAVDKIHLGLA